MKIISKYKDYYDYLVGIYGEDPLIILDRRNFENPFFISSDLLVVNLYICNLHIQGLLKDGKFYYGDNIEQFALPKRNLFRWREHDSVFIVKSKFGSNNLSINCRPRECSVNTDLNCPILLAKYTAFPYYNRNSINNYYKFPVLANLNIASILPPEDIWLLLSNFLAKKEIVVDNRTDKEKIVSAGFDLKESFRGKQ